MKYYVAPPDADDWPTCVALAIALEYVGAPAFMVVSARYGGYHDFLSHADTPEVVLLDQARKYNLPTIVEGVMEGRWDATKAESDRWAASPDGQKTLGMLHQRPRKKPRGPLHDRRN